MEEEKKKLSDLIRSQFDETFKYIVKNGREIPFSVDTILKDLLDSGLAPIQALEILDEIQPHLYPGIENRKIIKLINQAFQKHDFQEEFTKKNYLQPIIITYDDGSEKVFNYKAIKEFIRLKLVNFRYTSKTFKAITDELHRIILSLRTDRVKPDVLETMIPSILRNVIGLNPFSSDSLEEDYKNVLKMEKSLANTWDVLPVSEQISLLFTLYESFYRIVLLHFNYLPGYNFQSTITQVNQLIADLTEQQDEMLSDKEIYIMGKSSKAISELIHDETPDQLDISWLENSKIVVDITKRLIDKGSINWLILIDQSGNELFGKFNLKKDQKYKSLLGMAISGVQSLVNELTDKSIKQIEQDEGSILIERDQLFSLVAMVDKVTPAIQQILIEVRKYVRSNLLEELKNFKGDVSKFEETLDDHIEDNYGKFFS